MSQPPRLDADWNDEEDDAEADLVVREVERRASASSSGAVATRLDVPGASVNDEDVIFVDSTQRELHSLQLAVSDSEEVTDPEDVTRSEDSEDGEYELQEEEDTEDSEYYFSDVEEGYTDDSDSFETTDESWEYDDTMELTQLGEEVDQDVMGTQVDRAPPTAVPESQSHDVLITDPASQIQALATPQAQPAAPQQADILQRAEQLRQQFLQQWQQLQEEGLRAGLVVADITQPFQVGPAPPAVEPIVDVRERRQGRPPEWRRIPIPRGQQTIQRFLGGRRSRDDAFITRVITHHPPRGRARRQRANVVPNARPQRQPLDIFLPLVPSTPADLYDTWERMASELVPAEAAAYSNFIYAFGDDSEQGREYRRKEIMDIGNVLFEFQRKRTPGQQALLKGREREGKTVALFSIALVALILDMRVVILCAPNKVAPIVDMVKKLERAGFHRLVYMRHTLTANMARTHNIATADEGGRIFVAALGTVGDLNKVASYIRVNKSEGHLTVTLIDECDELTQGKGGKCTHIHHVNDPDAYHHYVEGHDDDEDLEDVEYIKDDRRKRRRVTKNQIAAASALFAEHINPYTQVFACSATLSGYILNPIGTFAHDKVTKIFKVWPKPGFRGIESYQIPDGCALDFQGNVKNCDQFAQSDPIRNLLKLFYHRENPCDGARLEPVQGSGASPTMLRGMLFVSVATKVYVSGGVVDLAKCIRGMLQEWHDGRDTSIGDSTLFICFVGKPRVYFAQKWIDVQAGASMEDIYNITAEHARSGKFPGVRLERNEPLSKVATHCVLIGYNLTRRAMTTAFTPKDEPGVLCKLLYQISTAPSENSMTIDAVSQRFTRGSHDFVEHVVPENYCVQIATLPDTLETLKNYREMEDEMAEKQRNQNYQHARFRHEIDVYAKNLYKCAVSKRKISLSEMSRRGRAQHRRKQTEIDPDMDDYLIRFKDFLKERLDRHGSRLFNDVTVKKYYAIVRQWFTTRTEIEEIVVCITEWVNRTKEHGTSDDDEHHNKQRANELFLEFYSTCSSGHPPPNQATRREP